MGVGSLNIDLFFKENKLVYQFGKVRSSGILKIRFLSHHYGNKLCFIVMHFRDLDKN